MKTALEYVCICFIEDTVIKLMPQKTITLKEWALSHYRNIQYISTKDYSILTRLRVINHRNVLNLGAVCKTLKVPLVKTDAKLRKLIVTVINSV